MKKTEMKEMKKQAKIKGKALADAHKGKPPRANTKATDAKHLERKPDSTGMITIMIGRIISTLDSNMDRLIGDMDVDTALATIERLQELRDTENYHALKWG